MRLIAIDLTARDAELIADRCWQAGAAGLWEVDESTLRAGVEDESVGEFLDALADLGPTDVSDEEAVELAGRTSVIQFAGQDMELWVPATIFGDGRHPTTATCLTMVAEVVGAGTTLLDVGCGAGALSVGAALLGGYVTAIDVDPAAVTATAANASRNGAAIEASPLPLAEVVGPYDVVVANMTNGSLGPLVADLVRVTSPGGTLIVSGLLEDQWPAVRDALGASATEVVVTDGWLSARCHVP